MLIESNRTFYQNIHYKTLAAGMLTTALGYFSAFQNTAYNYASLAFGLGLMGRAIYPACDELSQKVEKVWQCLPFSVLAIASANALRSIHTQQV